MARILIVDDKESMARMLALAFKAEGYEVITAKNAEEGLEKAFKKSVDLVVTDLKMPDKTGMELLEEIKRKDPALPVILMTAYGTIDTAVKAVKMGAYDFLVKPFEPDHLILLVQRALERNMLVKENVLLKEELAKRNEAPTIIGCSPVLVAVIEKIKKAADTNAIVLLEGESGTGKEVFAKTIHMLSGRYNKPFIPVNCAAIPKDLIESELFGHEKGSFTGATDTKIGKFELADKGTIFLDEIGDMNLTLQSKLLRVLEDYEITKVGGQTKKKVDVRVLAATNKNLNHEVLSGNFREDLYFRLSVIPIVIPPLRERGEDIILLAEHYIAYFCKETKKPVMKISDETKKVMLKHSWMGNVRELRNHIERSVILSGRDTIYPEDLGLNSSDSSSSPKKINLEGALHDVTAQAVKAVEKEMIKKVMKETGGNKSRASEKLQVSYKTLLTKIKEYGLE